MLLPNAVPRAGSRQRRVVVLLGWLLVAWMTGCSAPAPEQALRDTLDETQSAIDERDAGALRELLADDFVGPDGMTGQDLSRLAQGMFLRYRNTRVELSSPEIRLHGSDRANVQARALVWGSQGGLLPETGQAYTVSSGWRLEDGDWRLVSVQWERML